jgi:hypothetical protein
VGFSEAFGDGHSIRAAGNIFLASRALPSLDRKEAILLYSPSLHTIAFKVTLRSGNIRNGNPFWTRETTL